MSRPIDHAVSASERSGSCLLCLWFDPAPQGSGVNVVLNPGDGVCRRFPPTPVPTPMGVVSALPVISERFGCGEYLSSPDLALRRVQR